MPQQAVTNGYMNSEYFLAQAEQVFHARGGKALLGALEDPCFG